MKPTAILALILGGLAPIIALLPLLIAPLGGEDYWMAGWAFFFFSVPVGALFALAGGALAIVTASLALRRRTIAKAVPIVGICLIGAGLLVSALGGYGFASGSEMPAVVLSLVGILAFLTGILMSAVSGLRDARFGRGRRIR